MMKQMMQFLSQLTHHVHNYCIVIHQHSGMWQLAWHESKAAAASRSRMDLMKARNDLAAQLHTAEDKAAKLEAQCQEVENNLNAVLTEIERLEPKRLHLRCTSLASPCECYCHSNRNALQHQAIIVVLLICFKAVVAGIL